ncbi:MAG TPA: 1-acyl-sn-glycerol-3-phosphate acyltransferase [Candidatus Eubacterium faecipullorum]|uniref:1-acyl-sn-glycerol-3-phosphate acyltransferase n=1 Tax=Candidatus Eubacterium faecipullorum TaxID=2838571 RepID=A0A9D1UGT9_9FIRM|nr:1-acyl-sn-glycerol-3-phosphate acyltransferase [Candidatus Eubacterium faecipullorum]
MVSFDYSEVKHYKFYGFVKKVFGPLFRMIYKLEFKGLENVPPEDGGRYIVAINHTSAFDPVFVSMPKEVPPLHFMAKVELFKNPVVGWVIKHLYGFPVKRGKGDTSAIEYGEKIIEEGHVMAICPEGKRIKDKNGVPQKAKSGVAVIAKATNASVLPVAIYCDGPIKAGKKVVISYGKLLSLSDMGLDKEEIGPHDIKFAANTVMDKIIELWEAEHSAGN